MKSYIAHQNYIMRHFLIFMLLFSATTTFGQFATKGQKVLGGTLSFNTGKVSNDLNPEMKPYGYNIGGGFALGKFCRQNLLKTVSFYYGHGYGKIETSNNVSRSYSNSFYLAYGLTKYKKFANNLFFGLGGNVYSGFNISNYYNGAGPDKGESHTFNIGVSITPSLSYQLNNRFVVNLTANSQFLSINYFTGTSKYSSLNQPTKKGTFQSFNLDAGFFGSDLKNFTFGFNYLLKNKANKK